MEKEVTKTENATNATKIGGFRGAELSGESVDERQEQERTWIKKGLFLQAYAKSMTITAACEKADIDRKTYYRWANNDQRFEEEVKEIEGQRINIAEDVLYGLIFLKHHAPSVHFYLERKHPLYKPRSTTEVIAGERTLEDLLDEYETE